MKRDLGVPRMSSSCVEPPYTPERACLLVTPAGPTHQQPSWQKAELESAQFAC